MKKSAAFTLLLLSSFWHMAHACWYYPTGDDIRFCFFTDYRDYYSGYSMFNYTASYFSYDPPTDYRAEPSEDRNIALWVAYCNHKVSLQSVEEVIYGNAAIWEHDDNAMVQYLFRTKDNEALAYLKFAKDIEVLNTYYEDPWERDEDIVSPKRQSRIDVAIEKSDKAVNPIIKSRYRFLAIRMAFYNRDLELVKMIYDGYFAGKQANTVIDYWSLYFRMIAEKDHSLQSYYAAMVFANAPEKRFTTSYYFHNEVPLEQVLKYAKNNRETAAIYEIAGMRKTDYSLGLLEGIYKNSKASDALGFLLVREMNKLEDWIYTPYYSYFSPSLADTYEHPENTTTPMLLQRVAQDRQYAGKLLQFVNSVDLSKVKDPNIFRSAKAYLLFMVKDYNSCLSYINVIKKWSAADPNMGHQLALIKSLCLTANQPYGAAVIPEGVKPVLMAEASGNTKFAFAIGRELEYLGNTTDAALIYSKLGGMDWKARDQRSPYYDDYYSYYFDYMDGAYSTGAVQKLINAVKANKATDSFSKWLYENINDINQLYDLLGTKYIRLNRLTDALSAFDRMESGSRTSGYLDDNPFYELKYTSDFVQRRDSIQLTKADITGHLIKYIAKGNDPHEKDRDYYNFLAANCYLNMTQNGNTWYMRRYTWSSSELTSSLPDEADFHKCLYAKQYYLKAFRQAKSRKFRALCMRMAAHCEHKRIEYEYLASNDSFDYGRYDYALENNQYRKKIKKLYPAYYNDLYESGCTAYFSYFDARRQ